MSVFARVLRSFVRTTDTGFSTTCPLPGNTPRSLNRQWMFDFRRHAKTPLEKYRHARFVISALVVADATRLPFGNVRRNSQTGSGERPKRNEGLKVRLVLGNLTLDAFLFDPAGLFNNS